MIFVFLTWAAFKSALCAACFWLACKSFYRFEKSPSLPFKARLIYLAGAVLLFALAACLAFAAIEILSVRLNFNAYGLK